jgi:hypothetical protein
MDTKEDIRQLRLHFEGLPTQGHVIPAGALVQVLEAFQKVVHLIAMQKWGRSIQQRFRVSHEIEHKFPLICGIPGEGGYVLPVEIGGPPDQLFAVEDYTDVASTTRDVLAAINGGDLAAFDRSVPDNAYRRYILKAIDQMQPERHSGWVMHIEDSEKNRILDGTVASIWLQKFLEPRAGDQPPADFGYVAGTLIEMKFNERRLRLKMLKWGKSIDASYAEEFEPILLEHPRDIIQVHGNIVLGEDGAPQSISDVDDIIEVDESPIDIEIVSLPIGAALKARLFLQTLISFDPDSWLYKAEGPFDILLFAETRAQIEVQLDEELAMLWSEYTKVDPSALTAGAKKLQHDLLEAFEEVHDAD